MANTILIQGDPITREDNAHEAITPGHLVEFVPNQTFKKLRKHATSDGAAAAMFALEAQIVGEGIDHAYVSGELVRYAFARKGDVINARLKASTAVQAGDKLGSNGDGTLDIVDVTAAATVEGAWVAEAFENLASVASVQMLKVQIV